MSCIRDFKVMWRTQSWQAALKIRNIFSVLNDLNSDEHIHVCSFTVCAWAAMNGTLWNKLIDNHTHFITLKIRRWWNNDSDGIYKMIRWHIQQYSVISHNQYQKQQLSDLQGYPALNQYLGKSVHIRDQLNSDHHIIMLQTSCYPCKWIKACKKTKFVFNPPN